MMRALVDMDILVYQCGFASQTTTYKVGDRYFDYMSEAKKYCDEDFDSVEAIVEADPIAHCLHTVKLTMERILAASGADDYSGYLTGTGNYRYEIDPLYKANRDPKNKPVHAQAIRDYLAHTWQAEVVDGMEADDALGINQTQREEDTIICSIDKDMLTIPGNHYRWAINRKGEEVRPEETLFVTEEEADHHFFTQLLTGDAVDNIKGCKGIGPKKAEKILENCEGKEEMEEAVRKVYEKQYKDTHLEEMKKNWKLLYILRELPDAH